ncbi:hypothetical protein [Streptomyces lavendofoliae]|uniref:Uncharacterized protein n=1 Tax=Streptomyces lavendofoliae TaxID=67314 RepID=A0A918M5Z1_9ACTN|nr:hypothetical protein [Streptomyces lavendofoliae]GGU49278.1 hypothetical protein GCM10010274_42250 [Streptomyces lavendofoliae]
MDRDRPGPGQPPRPALSSVAEHAVQVRVQPSQSLLARLHIEQRGIIAWTFSASPSARRAGLVTLTAAVAAGEHAYRVRDLAADDAVPLAVAALPGVLEEFLEPSGDR